MAFKLRRGLETDRKSVIPAEGEPLYVTDIKQVFMGDGVTSGGNAITSMGKVGSFAVPVTATSYTIPTSGCYGSTLFYGAAGSATLPSGEVGMNLLIYNTAANVITVKPAGAEVIVVDGTAKAASGSFTLASGAGNFVTLIHDGLKWITLGAKGTLT